MSRGISNFVATHFLLDTWTCPARMSLQYARTSHIYIDLAVWVECILRQQTEHNISNAHAHINSFQVYITVFSVFCGYVLLRKSSARAITGSL